MDILYQDQQIAVCIKPIGIRSEDGDGSLPDLLRQALGGEIFPVHRLDLAVGGVMVYARTKSAAGELSRAIQDGSMIKEYCCLVHGTPPVAGDWTDFLWKDNRKNKVFPVKRMRKGVKEARLEFTRLTGDNPALIHVRLHTGRSHQIRVQFASRGFPLVGDHKYGARDEQTAPRLFSCRITFPYQGKIQTFEAYPDWYTVTVPPT